MENQKHSTGAGDDLLAIILVATAFLVFVTVTLRVYVPQAFQSPVPVVLEAHKASHGPVSYCEDPQGPSFPYQRVNFEVWVYTPCKEVPFDGRA